MIKAFLVLLLANQLQCLLFSSKPKCAIDTYKATSLGLSGWDVRVDKEFKTKLTALSKDISNTCKLKWAARDSFTDLSKLIANNKLYNNHAVGQQASIGRALSIELVNPTGKMLCNQMCLRRPSAPPVTNMECMDNVLFNHGFRRFQDVIYDEFYDSNNMRFVEKKREIIAQCTN